MKKNFLPFFLFLCGALAIQAESFDALWSKYQKLQATQPAKTRLCVDKMYQRSLSEGNVSQLARVLFAYDVLGVTLSEDTVVANAQRVWAARRKERNAVQHAILTHMLGRLTDNDYLLALSVADTTFLRAQKARDYLPVPGESSLYDVFCGYLLQRDMPDSVFVGWVRPVEEDTVVRKHYSFDVPPLGVAEATPQTTPQPVEYTQGEAPVTVPATTSPSVPQPVKVVPAVPSVGSVSPVQPSTSSPSSPVPAPAPALNGAYCAYVFNVPGGLSRMCVVETVSGRPVKRWRLHRDDGRGQENDINADGNGHVWQRPKQIHNYAGIYNWSLQPVATDSSRVNTLGAQDFHNGGGWNAGENESRELRIDVEKIDTEKGVYSITLRAPHRNLTLMRDITSGGKLVEQRQYQFSDFIHFDLTWREAYGDSALVTFAYAYNGHLYTADIKISRPRGL